MNRCDGKFFCRMTGVDGTLDLILTVKNNDFLISLLEIFKMLLEY